MSRKANDYQEGGSHYKDMAIEPWEMMEASGTRDELRGYHKFTALAYIARERYKGEDEDIRKATHHLTKLVELLDQWDSEDNNDIQGV